MPPKIWELIKYWVSLMLDKKLTVGDKLEIEHQLAETDIEIRNEIEDIMTQIAYNRAEQLDAMLERFIADTGLTTDEIVLVEEKTEKGYRWYYQKRIDRV